MQLRGYDSYDISLGDEMRGERATLGKSLEDAERDLRIKARMITAIENGDLSGFPNQSVIAGYVRSYARYLGMDAEDCYQRFCDESGYKSPAALMSSRGEGSGFGSFRDKVVTSKVGAEIGLSRFAAPPVTNRFRARIPLGAVTSALALVALIVGLAYGGYALLQDIQRVGFAPLPDAPVVVADAPLIDSPAPDQQDIARPAADDYLGGGVLAAVAAPANLTPIEAHRRDGPISAIDPETAGMFARLREELPEPAAPPAESNPLAVHQDIESAEIAVPHETEDTPAVRGIVVHATEDAWIRVSGGDDSVLYEGIMQAGGKFAVPLRADTPRITSGNAGGTYVSVDGALFGPLGARGRIAKNVSLRAEDVRGSMPEADMTAIRQEAAPEDQQRAEASVGRN